MGKELALNKQETIKEIETALATCTPEKLKAMSMMEQTFALADAVGRMRQAFTGEVLQVMKRLQNTSLGFLTDRKEGQPYNDEIVRDCVIEAMLKLARPVGNEFNIIAGRAYLTKQYFENRLRDFPGLTELRYLPGVPHMTAQGALVPFVASWKLNGIPDEINCTETEGGDFRICVRSTQGAGVDNILGKATRKILARVFARVTGSEWIEAETETAVDLEPPEAAEPEQEPFDAEASFALEAATETG